MLLGEILKRGNNNLDLFRLIAACMVILGHAYALLPGSGGSDVISSLLGFDYSGSLAVKIFFFISGMLVTSSLLQKQSIPEYISARFFRIWPALIAVLAITTFILGPLFTTLSAGDYFSNPDTYKYFFHHIFMQYNSSPPGVFQNSAVPALNGSLWTIPLEVFAYVLLAGVFIIGKGLKNPRPVILAGCVFIIINQIFGNAILFTNSADNLEIAMLGPCFATGAIFALYKDKIDINLAVAVGLWVMYFVFRQAQFNYYLFYPAIFYSILFVASRESVKNIKLPFDASFVFIYGDGQFSKLWFIIFRNTGCFLIKHYQ